MWHANSSRRRIRDQSILCVVLGQLCGRRTERWSWQKADLMPSGFPAAARSLYFCSRLMTISRSVPSRHCTTCGTRRRVHNFYYLRTVNQ